MGVLPSAKAQATTPAAAKRRSGQLDFSNLGPLKTTGTVGFSAFREQAAESSKRRKGRKKSNGSLGAMDEDSEEDDDEPEILGKMEDIDDKEVKPSTAPEDVKFTGELADGVDRIKVCLFIMSTLEGLFDTDNLCSLSVNDQPNQRAPPRPTQNPPTCPQQPLLRTCYLAVTPPVALASRRPRSSLRTYQMTPRLAAVRSRSNVPAPWTTGRDNRLNPLWGSPSRRLPRLHLQCLRPLRRGTRMQPRPMRRKRSYRASPRRRSRITALAADLVLEYVPNNGTQRTVLESSLTCVWNA